MLTLFSREIPSVPQHNPMGHTLVSHNIQSTKRAFNLFLTTQIMITRALQIEGEVHLNLALPPIPILPQENPIRTETNLILRLRS